MYVLVVSGEGYRTEPLPVMTEALCRALFDQAAITQG